MQKSISSRPAVLGFLCLALLGLAPGRADEFIDDEAIKAAFETDLSRRFKAGGLVTGAAFAEQLRQASASAQIPEIAPPEASPESAFSRARAATLVLGHLFLCDQCDKHHASLSGGVLLSADGLALTNYHVLDNRQAIVFGARTADGRVFPIKEILAASKDDDLALVRLRDARDLPFVGLGDDPAGGDEVFVVSHPDGHFYTLTRGHLSRKFLAAETHVPRLQITADFAKGSSGCGIFDLAGNLAGLATATSSIHYRESEGKGENLQMVLKVGVPASSIRKLLGVAGKP